MLSKKKILDMENEELLFEIKLFRNKKRMYFKKKYPNITESEMLKKINRSQKRKFGNRQNNLIKQIADSFFLK